MPAQKIGRNDPCVCGSGKKYKHCCESKQRRKGQGLTFTVAAVVIAIAIALVMAVVAYWQNPNAGQPSQVWSPEHGHYHTVP